MLPYHLGPKVDAMLCSYVPDVPVGNQTLEKKTECSESDVVWLTCPPAISLQFETEN